MQKSAVALFYAIACLTPHALSVVATAAAIGTRCCGAALKGAEDQMSRRRRRDYGSQGAPASVASRQADTMDAVQQTPYKDYLNQVLNDTESARTDDII